MNSVSAFTSIPIIDVSGLRSADPAEHRRVADELGEAARNVGFLYVTGHGMPPALFDDMLAYTKRFFALPYEEKMRSYIGLSTCHRGYVPVGEEGYPSKEDKRIDLKEAFDTGVELPVDDPDYVAGNPMLGPNQWPDIPGFAEAVTAYYDAVMQLGRRMLRAFAEALGESPELFDAAVTKPPSQLRLVHYPVDAEAIDQLGIGAHTDFECFTLLRPTAPGLEVLNGVGDWIDVPPLADAIVVNIGDLLETWTNGRYVATTHRVRRVTEERYAFPLFFNVDYYTEIAPLPQFVGTGDPKRAAVVAGEHLLAQTAYSFKYLRAKVESGELTLPAGALGPDSFGQLARKPELATDGSS
jgi:isopenicillin N synthase-like dioxygenase